MNLSIRREGPIVFTEHDHKYVNELTNEQYLSVTTLIKKYETEFPEDEIASAIAIRDKRNKEDIINEWRNIAAEAADYGTRVHNLMERYLLANGVYVPADDFEKEILESYQSNKSIKFTGKIIPEQLVYLNSLKLAGQSDIIELIGDDYFDVSDWKTNKMLNYYSKYDNWFKAPLSHLSQCEYNIYALQLSTYAYMYEKMSGRKCRRISLIHYNKNFKMFKQVPINYMKFEVMGMLKHYRDNYLRK